MQQFFITGLPRSRTFWFARYFNAMPNVRCYHELINTSTGKNDFYSSMVSGYTEYIGNSDSGLYMTDFQTVWPEAPVVIIERPVDDVENSLNEFLPRMGYNAPDTTVLTIMAKALAGIKGLRVPFDGINDLLPEIHEHIGMPFNSGYANYMANKNLQLQRLEVNLNNYLEWGIS